MRIVSVNVGLPRQIEWQGKAVCTSVFKEPVSGRVMLRTLNLDGDRQGDTVSHGGPKKAVFAYPLEHYRYWRDKLPGVDLPIGVFAENFTVEGMDESSVNIGDRFRFGSALVLVAQPRMPCFRLSIRFNNPEIVTLYQQSDRPGFYMAVLEEGEVGAGDAIELVHRDPHHVTVADVNRLYFKRIAEPHNLLERALKLEALPEKLKNHIAG
ncbi:MAG TPA: MOSC domain-containing protein [Blastocatellia bacterium]|nr:MOSC domain-containing protein [Blastocatellia bacterium]